MKIEPMFTNDKDGYKFKINDAIILEIADTAVSVLEIAPQSDCIEVKERYNRVRERFDIEKMVQDLLDKNNKIKQVVIDSGACYVDGEFIFQTYNLEKYKNKLEFQNGFSKI